MNQNELICALLGAIFALAGVAGLYFWRFWIRTGDRLFIFFAFAFWFFALERFFLIWMKVHGETHPLIYLIRLASFLFIAIGIIDKNRGKLR